jgi:hypothetical protein
MVEKMQGLTRASGASKSNKDARISLPLHFDILSVSPPCFIKNNNNNNNKIKQAKPNN